jgi:hypothetical protein
VFLTAETDVTRRQYELLTGLPVHLLTHPVTLPDGASTRSEPPLQSPRVSRGTRRGRTSCRRRAAFRSGTGSARTLVMQWENDFTFRRARRTATAGRPARREIHPGDARRGLSALLRSASRPSCLRRSPTTALSVSHRGHASRTAHPAHGDTWLAAACGACVGPAVLMRTRLPRSRCAGFIGLPALLDAAAGARLTRRPRIARRIRPPPHRNRADQAMPAMFTCAFNGPGYDDQLPLALHERGLLRPRNRCYAPGGCRCRARSAAVGPAALERVRTLPRSGGQPAHSLQRATPLASSPKRRPALRRRWKSVAHGCHLFLQRYAGGPSAIARRRT